MQANNPAFCVHDLNVCFLIVLATQHFHSQKNGQHGQFVSAQFSHASGELN
jgi:hypothetical protein